MHKMIATKILVRFPSLPLRYNAARFFAAQPGTVKFYLRDKGYGFVQPDSSPDTDVFIHRNVLSSTHDIPEDVLESSVRYPYLKQKERVMFEMEFDESGMRRAKNVTWLNGSKIPPERKNYLGGVHERAKRILGEAIFSILDGGEQKNDSATLEEIRKEFESAKMAISNGEEVVKRLGMDVSDFPTEKARAGRGRYLFEGELANEKLTQGEDGSDQVLNKHLEAPDDEEMSDEELLGFKADK